MRNKSKTKRRESEHAMTMSMHSGSSYPQFNQSLAPDPCSPLSKTSRDKIARREEEIRMNEENLRKLKEDISKARGELEYSRSPQ